MKNSHDKKAAKGGNWDREADPHAEREARLYDVPLPSREYIMEALAAEGVPVEEKDLARLLGIKRKEAELRRALLVTEHPEIGDAIGAIEGRVFAVTRAEEKAGHGLSKAELRRRETIDKKLASLREKRVELDSQIGALEQELAGLGSEQLAAFEAERRQALTQLLVTISTHASALSAVGLDANSLVPDRLLSEIEAIAREVSAQS